MSQFLDMDLVVIGTTIVSSLIGFPIARAIAERINGKHSSPRAADSPEVAARLASIEHTVESIAVEVERLTEHQRFVTKLLSARAGAELPPKDGG